MDPVRTDDDFQPAALLRCAGCMCDQQRLQQQNTCSPGWSTGLHLTAADWVRCCVLLQTLLRRLEKRLSAAGVTCDGAQSLLRQLSPSAPAGRKLERYPVRVMLCAYMVKEHPEVVFNSVVSTLINPPGGTLTVSTKAAVAPPGACSCIATGSKPVLCCRPSCYL